MKNSAKINPKEFVIDAAKVIFFLFYVDVLKLCCSNVATNLDVIFKAF